MLSGGGMRVLARVLGVMIVFGGVADVAYTIGRGQQKAIFLSTHAEAFEHYSELLVTLADQEDPRALRGAVRFFDREWKKDTQSPRHIFDVVSALERQTLAEQRGSLSSGKGHIGSVTNGGDRWGSPMGSEVKTESPLPAK